MVQEKFLIKFKKLQNVNKYAIMKNFFSVAILLILRLFLIGQNDNNRFNIQFF